MKLMSVIKNKFSAAFQVVVRLFHDRMAELTAQAHCDDVPHALIDAVAGHPGAVA
jgi:hypothetical protein